MASDIEKLNRNVQQLINSASRNQETFGSRFPMASIVVGAYKIMTIEQLEQLRYILNKIIKQKKILKRINDTSHFRETRKR